MNNYSVLDGSNHDAVSSDETQNNIPSKPSLMSVILIPVQLIANSIQSLKSCPKELYVNFILNFCNCYSYFALTQILVIYLHDEFGVSDLEAGFVYGTYAACITFWGLFTSWINDNLGVRVSLIIGFALLTFSTLLVACVRTKIILYIALFVLVPFSFGVGMPMLVVGIKRYTTTENRGFVYGLYYAVMNIAAFVSGPVVDLCNIVFHQGMTIFGTHFSGNRLVLLSAACVYFVGLIISYSYLREIKVVEDPAIDDTITNNGTQISTIELSILHSKNEKDDNSVSISDSGRSSRCETDIEWSVDESSPRDSSRLMGSGASSTDELTSSSINNNQQITRSSNIQEYTPEVKTFLLATSELLTSPTFWRYLAVTLILISVTALISYTPDATMPTYLIRCYGKHYPKGLVYSINPFLCIFLTPLVAALTSSYSHYDMIKWGSLLAALAPLCLVFFTTTWSVIMYNILLSCGEAVWSPRTYDYTMSIAPEGREASFTALSSAPLLLSNIPLGALSGYLITTYLVTSSSGSSDGSEGTTSLVSSSQCGMIWIAIGGLAMSSPVLLILLEHWIREPSHRHNCDGKKIAIDDPESSDSSLILEQDI